MSEMLIEETTTKATMEEIRPLLDAALKKQFPGGMLVRKWNGEVLELSGPGAQGSIVFVDGKLIGKATLKPPASMMRPVIEQKIGAAIKEAAG